MRKTDGNTTATVRVAPLLPVTRVVSDLGGDPASVLAEAGWSPSLLVEPETTVPYAAAGRLLAVAAARTGCEHIGLLVGQEAGLTSLGALGFAVRHAPDVRSALRLLATRLATHDSGGVVTVFEDGPTASLGYRVSTPDVPGSEQIADCAISIGCEIMRALCGPDWRPVVVDLARRRPTELKPYQAQFGSSIRFDAEDSAIAFAVCWLARPTCAPDPELQRLLLRMIREAAPAPDPCDDVRRVPMGFLGRAPVSQDAVARVFGVSSRTLHRRLASVGTSFQDLLDAVRCDTACRLLEDTALPIGRVALVLDYGEASAFTRAFKRRMGCSPTESRAQHAAMAAATEKPPM